MIVPFMFNLTVLIMKRIIIKLEQFRDFIEQKIYRLTNEPVKTDHSVKNLLASTLRDCYTLKEIARLKEIFEAHQDLYSYEEFICFSSEIRYQISLVNKMNQYFNDQYLCTVAQLASAFKASTYTECDVIWLHIKKNAKRYAAGRKDGLAIFEKLYCNRKMQIREQLMYGA